MKLIYYFSWNINKKIEKFLWIHEVYESMKSILSSGKSDTTKRNGSNISQNEAQKKKNWLLEWLTNKIFKAIVSTVFDF